MRKRGGPDYPGIPTTEGRLPRYRLIYKKKSTSTTVKRVKAEILCPKVYNYNKIFFLIIISMEILIYIWPKIVRTARGSRLPTDRCISLLEANILT
jgi:hypothetical protein